MEKKKIFLFLIAVFILSSSVSGALVDEVIARVNDVICIFLCIIWYIIAGLAALLLVLAGVKYISSESPDERDESRKRIFNALVGLIIVLIAVPFVNYLIQNTSIMAFRGCNCVFPPANVTTTTTPHGIVTTTLHITTIPEDTTTFVVATTTTTTTGGTTTTTYGEMITCNVECIIAPEGYKSGTCKDICDPNEVDNGQADDCHLPKTCCCVPYTSTTTTTTTTTSTTTTVTGTTTTVVTTTTSTTTSTTTTIPCATPKCPDPSITCPNAQSAGLCYPHMDNSGKKIPGLDDVCGSGYRACCCQKYNPNCCGPAPP